MNMKSGIAFKFRKRFCAIAISAMAFTASSPSTARVVGEDSKTMNGIKLSDYVDFEKKWQLVTVRFRKDTGELRFTYANRAAWMHLKKLSEKPATEIGTMAESYPRGAVFAKVGIATSEDPAFASSAVPRGARRVQFMVRDGKKFADTDGWGYALFDSGGNTFPGDLNQTSKACAACHKIVPERGYVFSQFMTGLVPKSPLSPAAHSVGGSQSPRLAFETVDTKDLPDFLQLQLPPKTEKVRSLQGPMTQDAFSGTLDEVRPELTREAIRFGAPAMLLSRRDGAVLYSIVYSTGKQGLCTEGQMEYLGVMNTTEKAETVQSVRFCESQTK
ncbi:MAG: cytochrome P460 family protein [Deltaproteobacteria bacterium]|jgi:hypothetical protein|nr:cytochrome P460 family protein [Deltaproteobacteria bacterium]